MYTPGVWFSVFCNVYSHRNSIIPLKESTKYVITHRFFLNLNFFSFQCRFKCLYRHIYLPMLLVYVHIHIYRCMYQIFLRLASKAISLYLFLLLLLKIFAQLYCCYEYYIAVRLLLPCKQMPASKRKYDRKLNNPTTTSLQTWTQSLWYIQQ